MRLIKKIPRTQNVSKSILHNFFPKLFPKFWAVVKKFPRNCDIIACDTRKTGDFFFFEVKVKSWPFRAHFQLSPWPNHAINICVTQLHLFREKNDLWLGSKLATTLFSTQTAIKTKLDAKYLNNLSDSNNLKAKKKISNHWSNRY